MMEEYTFNLQRSSIKYGKFENKVYQIHLNKYGKESADRILEKCTEILKESILQKNDPKRTSNSLIIGKVQSGKTSNLEMISALAFDNGFNMLIIYGGYDNTLLDQCIKRFTKIFDPENDNEDVQIISTSNDTINVVDDNFLKRCIDEKTPIIIIGLKRPSGLDKINEVLSDSDLSNIKSFIIDDEGDQASLNVAKDKTNEKEASATYASIKKMKQLLGDPIYFPVTATPMANVFLPDLSVLRPDSLHLVYPASNYTGAETFHLLETNIESANDVDVLDNGCLSKSLEDALKHFIVASAIMLKRGEKKSCMIIHSYREVAYHKVLYKIVDDYIGMYKYSLENGDEKSVYEPLSKTLNELFNENLRHKYTLDSIKEEISTIIKSIKIVIRNSGNKNEEESLKYYRNVIHIGGDLLQRGVTFDNLLTTYFTRWSDNGNMDTSLQRARWFGYRKKYLDLCKVYMPDKVKMEFSNLASIENDLWEQFEQIERGELSIEDIVIDAEDTSLRPTRRNVANIKKIGFTKKWFNQRMGIFDINQIKKCKVNFENLIFGKDVLSTNAGRTDERDTARYIKIRPDEFMSFMEQSDFIFNQSPFSIQDLKYILKDEDYINLVLMFDGPRKEVRERSFSEGKISALQQGADALNPDDVNYLGDAHVIPERNIMTVQVFKVVPKINNELKEEYTQYMFSIHVPRKRTSYVRG